MAHNETVMLSLLKDNDKKEISLVKRRVKEIIQSKNMCFRKLKCPFEENARLVADRSYVKAKIRQVSKFEEQLVKGVQPLLY